MIDGLLDHPLLAPLSAREQKKVARLCDEIVLPEGAVLMESGAPARGLHLLLDGRVEVLVHVHDEIHEVAVLGEGSVVGEQSLLTDGARSGADVRALTEVRAALVPRDRAAKLLEVGGVAVQLDAISRARRATNRALRVPPVVAGRVDGQLLELRPLWPEDWRQLATGIDRFSETSLRKRFFHLPRFSEQTFRRLTLTDHSDQFAWGATLDGIGCGVGRYALQAEDRSVAELAVIVADDMHGNGIGWRLVAAIAAAAHAHGAKELYALALADNTAIKALLRKFGAEWTRGSDPTTVEARWPVADALAAVDDRQLLEGAHAVAAAVLGDVVDT